MRGRMITAMAALSTAALIVVGIDYATYAANGSSLVLGRVNHEQSRTAWSGTARDRRCDWPPGGAGGRRSP